MDDHQLIFAWDMATKTGWAVGRDGREVYSGMKNFALRRGETQGILFMQFSNFVSYLVSSNKGPGDKLIFVYEEAHFRGGAATQVCVGLRGVLLESAARLGAEVMSVRTRELKMFATGKGNASKEEMVIAARERGGPQNGPIIDDNHADALWLLWYAQEMLGKDGRKERAA